jgi:monoamine oxidase
VVLAVPPSVWDVIEITPSLPTSLKPQMGKSVKYLAHVSNRFWRATGRRPSSVTDGMIGATWEATSGQSGPAAVLTAFSSGPNAETCLRLWARERNSAYRSELERIFPGFQHAFVSSRFVAWPEEPWTRAGYSFPAPGQITALGPTLRDGIGRLHFAGEHTCYKFVGYMEGALDSGAALARRLAVRDGFA